MNQENIDSLYGRRFFRRRIRKYQDKEIKAANIIYKILKPNSVFDVGCALGSYLLEYKRLGCLVSGCDKYFNNAEKFCDSKIINHLSELDAGSLWECFGKFDLVQCIEVAEHLLPDQSLNLIYNLCNSSSKYILFTSNNSDKGVGHINCRSEDFWNNMFNLFKFELDEEKSNEIEEDLKDLKIIKGVKLFTKVE